MEAQGASLGPRRMGGAALLTSGLMHNAGDQLNL